MQLSLYVIHTHVSLAHQFCNICNDIGHIPTACFINWTQLANLYPGEPENWTVGANLLVLWTPNYTVCSMILDTFTLYVLLTGHFWTQASLIHPGTFHLELDTSGVVTFDLWCDIRDARSRLELIPTDRIMGVIIRG